MTTDRVQRRYSVGDPEMIDVSQRYLSQFPNYYSNFANLDSETFHEGFHQQLGVLISEAADIPSDDALLGEFMSQTEDVNEVREESVDLLGKAKYYIRKAAQGDRGFMTHFGYDKLSSVRESNVRMADHLSKFNTAVALKREELLAAKMPEELMQHFEALEISMKKERDEQVQAKINRIDMTKRRIALLNRIWDTMVIITDANRFANPGDTTAAEIFTLPYPDGKPEKEDDVQE